MLGENFMTISPFNEDKLPVYFESEKDAEKYVKGMLEKSKYFSERLSAKISETNDEKEKDKIIDLVLGKIKEYTGSEWSVVVDFMEDMYRNRENNYELNNIGYSIVQCVVK